MKVLMTLLMAAVCSVTLAGCASSVAPQGGAAPAAATADAFAPAKVPAGFIKGADLSTLKEMEDVGYVYKDLNGNPGDCMQILKDQGFNYVRLRLWNDPYDANGNTYGGGTNDLPTDIALAKRAKALGLKFLLDFHYSDFWTDPGKQFKPKAWEKLSFEDLNKALYTYTKETIEAFAKEGVMPDMVQVGNELNSGMLWPDGKSWGQNGGEFDRLATLLKSAIQGVRDGGGTDCQIMLHLAEGPKKDTFKWWFDEITARDVPFDIIGMSMYTWWHGTIPQLKESMEFCAERYGKEINVVEAAYAYTLENLDGVENTFTANEEKVSGYPATPEGQAAFFRDLMEAVASVKGGNGIFYWEPAWKSAPGITWATQAGMDYTNDHWKEGNTRENQALFDNDGKLLPSVKVFNNL